MKELGTDYGDLPVHHGLWESAHETSHSLFSRLAIIHLVHEARGLDTNPRQIQRCKAAGESASLVPSYDLALTFSADQPQATTTRPKPSRSSMTMRSPTWLAVTDTSQRSALASPLPSTPSRPSGTKSEPTSTARYEAHTTKETGRRRDWIKDGMLSYRDERSVREPSGRREVLARGWLSPNAERPPSRKMLARVWRR